MAITFRYQNRKTSALPVFFQTPSHRAVAPAAARKITLIAAQLAQLAAPSEQVAAPSAQVAAPDQYMTTTWMTLTTHHVVIVSPLISCCKQKRQCEPMV